MTMNPGPDQESPTAGTAPQDPAAVVDALEERVFGEQGNPLDADPESADASMLGGAGGAEPPV